MIKKAGDTKNQKRKIKKENRVKTTEERRNKKTAERLKQEEMTIIYRSAGLMKWLSKETMDKFAILTGYTQRSNAKITPFVFVFAMVYGMFGDGASTFVTLASSIEKWFKVYITPQALFGRISKDKTVQFLKIALFEAMNHQLLSGLDNRYAIIFKFFTGGVKLEDSTQFTLSEEMPKGFKGCGGSGSKSAVKLNFVYDITRNTVDSIDIESGCVPDQKFKNIKKFIRKKMLWIRDLGYFNTSDMVIINAIGAFFLSRFKRGVKLFINQSDTTSVEVLSFLKKQTEGGKILDQDVYVGAQKVPVRIICRADPDSVKEKRIKQHEKNKIKRDKNKVEPTEDFYTWFGYSIYITNIPRNVMSAENILTVYRIRWQIELFFKRLKSILEIQIIKGNNVNRVLCIIYAKLISVLVAESIISYAASIASEIDDEELSEYKLLKWLKVYNRLGNALIVGAKGVEILLCDLICSYYLLCKNKGKKKKSTLKIIKESFNTEKTDCEPLVKTA